MIQLRKLRTCILQKSIKEKQANGTYIDKYVDVDCYKISLQELLDEVSANIYGANINKTYRISSPYNKLEFFLSTKLVDNNEDNISKYFIYYNNKRYKIVSVKMRWIDIELL